MHDKFLALTPDLYHYVVAHGAPPADDLLHELTAETASLGPEGRMQIAVEQGTFLTMLARLMNARRAVEVGTFTGYGAICIARGLAEGGRLTCFEVDPELAAVARANVEAAGLGDRVTIKVGPAAEGLAAIPEVPQVDLAYVDADKLAYPDYYDGLVPRMRPGGVIVPVSYTHLTLPTICSV